ncbi:MAG: hypothetical protein AAGD35_21995 [Actinomycetota bacterium]
MRTVSRHWLFIPSPLLGPASWSAVADRMEQRNQRAVVARAPMTTTADNDHVEPWVGHIASMPRPDDDRPVVVVGHSAACPRIPLVVDELRRRGWKVENFICVDGRFPDGKAFTESASHFGALLDSIVRPDDYLPPWPRWWGSLVEGLVVDPSARDQVFSEAAPIPRKFFDQPCPVPELSDHVGAGFLSFGPGYADARDRAHAAGWMTFSLDGDHLHQVVDPDGVTRTLEAMVACMETGR